MERDEIRLKCLELALNRTQHPDANVVAASIYEKYVVGALDESKVEGKDALPEAPVKRGPGRPPKSTGNPDILS